MLDFSGGVAHQQTPGVAGFPTYDVDIVSPELPCGAAWLVNCLLELGVAAWKPWNLRDDADWQPLGGRRFRYINRDAPLRGLLPSLATNREFDFLATPVPRIYHYWPGFYLPVRRTIFFVRDPRDALYSAWRRVEASRSDHPIDFCNFVASRYFHYPFSIAEYLLLFLRLWRDALQEREHLIVRYEDYRDDAARTLRRVTDFLGMRVNDVEIRRAVECSSFETARRIEADAADGNASAPINRAGIAREYRQSFDESMHNALGGRYREIYEWLGYAADRSTNRGVVANWEADSAPILRAMLFEQAQTTQAQWLAERTSRHSRDIRADAWRD